MSSSLPLRRHRRSLWKDCSPGCDGEFLPAGCSVRGPGSPVQQVANSPAVDHGRVLINGKAVLRHTRPGDPDRPGKESDGSQISRW